MCVCVRAILPLSLFLTVTRTYAAFHEETACAPSIHPSIHGHTRVQPCPRIKCSYRMSSSDNNSSKLSRFSPIRHPFVRFLRPNRSKRVENGSIELFEIEIEIGMEKHLANRPRLRSTMDLRGQEGEGRRVKEREVVRESEESRESFATRPTILLGLRDLIRGMTEW